MEREILARACEIGGPRAEHEESADAQSVRLRARFTFAPNSAQIVSPPFACGVAWLINALLFLDIRVTNAGFESDHWRLVGNAWRISESAERHLKWHLPILHKRQSFSFPEAINVRWEHRLDFASGVICRTILFVRDPRDAVYSLYRRNYAESMSFVSFLNRPDEWPHHFPGMFHMPPLESYAYFCWFWLAMGEAMPVNLIRFEDVKTEPVSVLREVLRYLGVERSEAQIHAAIESSHFEQAQQAMERMERDTGKRFITARKGQVGEWRTSFSRLARASVREPIKTLMRHLGYSFDSGSSSDCQVFEDYREQINRLIPQVLRQTSTTWLLATEEGHAPNSAAIAAGIKNLVASGKDILKLAAIAEAIYYVQRIFVDTSSPQARIALNVFVNLNLSYFHQWPVQIAALHGLRRIETESGVPMLPRLGRYRHFQLRALNRMWELF